LRVVAPLLEEPVVNRPDRAQACGDQGPRGREHSRSQLSKALRKKFPLPAAGHTLKGRQVAGEVDRIGFCLQLLEQQAAAGDIVLRYGDASEALTHPYLAGAWAKSD
jgi:hypothetical protein